jgi:hypothetical protein
MELVVVEVVVEHLLKLVEVVVVECLLQLWQLV